MSRQLGETQGEQKGPKGLSGFAYSVPRGVCSRPSKKYNLLSQKTYIDVDKEWAEHPEAIWHGVLPSHLTEVIMVKPASIPILAVISVVGVLGFLTPAYAETWDFATPTGVIASPHNYAGTVGTIITATAFGPNSPSLFGKNEAPDDVGLGLTNSPIRDGEITPGSFVQLGLSNINFVINSVNMSFKANSTTDGEQWELFGTNTPGTLAGATLLGSCATAPGSGAGGPCEALTTIMGLGNFKFADFTAVGQDATIAPGQPSTVLLSEINTTASVPGPIVGTGLPGLITACGGLIALARRRRRQLA